MNNRFLVGAGLSVLAAFMFAKDPIIMKVNGDAVPKSEFEYLYHKNRQQQMTPQPLQEYVEMFKLYKLKVADAKAEGIDTTATFLKEMAQYKRELAQPYLTDSLYIKELVEEAALRGREEVEVSHIMLAKKRTDKENREQKVRLDSIRNAIMDGADFEEMAKKYSADRGSSSKGGYMGYMPANRYPYSFETAAYNLPAGEISGIIETPMGYHLLKTGKRRPSRGKVHAYHIMKMSRQDDSSEKQNRAKASIDSIYRIVKAHPERFSEVAKSESEDRGSAVKGGELPWFGTGEMVPEFENVAFSLEEGEVSGPVRTQYGWHIILVDGRKGPASAEELKPEMLQRFQSPQDDRREMIRDHNMNRLAVKHHAKVNRDVLSSLKGAAFSEGIDSLFVESHLRDGMSDLTLVEIEGRKYPVREYLSTLKGITKGAGEASAQTIEKTVTIWLNNLLTDTELDWLYGNEADYRNLMKEYYDGSLLYEVSLRKVWDKASKDKEGLERYFRTNKDKYNWTTPHVKGLLVQAVNDSVAEVLKARMDALPGDSIIPLLRKEFKGKALIDRVLVEKGGNPMVDNLMFGAPEVVPTGNYTVYFLYNPRILTKPEELSDVRGAVTGDYQTELENQWTDELRRKYPVEVNEKELKKLR